MTAVVTASGAGEVTLPLPTAALWAPNVVCPSPCSGDEARLAVTELATTEEGDRLPVSPGCVVGAGGWVATVGPGCALGSTEARSVALSGRGFAMSRAGAVLSVGDGMATEGG